MHIVIIMYSLFVLLCFNPISFVFANKDIMGKNSDGHQFHQ